MDSKHRLVNDPKTSNIATIATTPASTNVTFSSSRSNTIEPAIHELICQVHIDFICCHLSDLHLYYNTFHDAFVATGLRDSSGPFIENAFHQSALWTVAEFLL